MRKKTVFAIILVLISMLSFQCYYVRQGVVLFDLYLGAEDINRVLERNNLPISERELLLKVKDIKHYAVSVLGLADNSNYSTYIRMEKEYLADVVSACDALSFTQYRWNYIFMGELPYKGFFCRDDALEEAGILRDQGYDVYVRHVDAFSTLGILSDPVFSFMKDYPIYYLAELIFHEQAHATLFLSGKPVFNENFATFVGEMGMRRYIREKYGDESEEYRIALSLEADGKMFVTEIQSLYHQLEVVFSKDIPKDEKLKLKNDTIEAWKGRFRDNYQARFKTNLYKNLPNREINNAVLMTYMNYREKQDAMDELFDLCGRDIVVFIKVARGLKEGGGDPMARLRELIEKNNNAVSR